jgi:hypothetical protein
MIPRRSLAAAIVAGSLAAPAAALAMPIDYNRPVPPKTASPAPPPAPRTIVESGDETLPIARAGAALLVAMSTAGYSVLRLAPLRQS